MISTDFKSRLNRFILFAAVLTAAFCVFLYQWVRFCLNEDLFSYTLIIPAVSAWLIWQQKEKLRFEFTQSSGAAISVGGLAVLALIGSFLGDSSSSNGVATAISFRVMSYVLWLIAGSLFVLGGSFIKQILFPVVFLMFMTPFPPAMVYGVEIALQNASAVVSGWFFSVIGLSHLQDGRIFQLPNITIEVAQECSGIRSTIVLFITGLIAGYLFLQKNWQRAVFCALIIPLGIARNAFRIVTIGWLCTHYGPEMIHSPIHHRGGPVFFALSLVPLFLLLWFFRRLNRSNNDSGSSSGSTDVGLDECASKVG